MGWDGLRGDLLSIFCPPFWAILLKVDKTTFRTEIFGIYSRKFHVHLCRSLKL